MSEFADRIITVEAIENKSNPNATVLVGFEIQPPINVHNSDFLQDAVQSLGWDNKISDFSIISAVKVNYSDDESTHGTMKVQAHTAPEKFQDLIERSFVPALSLGEKTVQLVFKTDAS